MVERCYLLSQKKRNGLVLFEALKSIKKCDSEQGEFVMKWYISKSIGVVQILALSLQH